MSARNKSAVQGHVIRFNTFQTYDDYFKDLQRFVDDQGLYQYLYTALPAYYVHNESAAPPIMSTTYDSSWVDYYADRRYDLEDPALKYCLSPGSSAPFVWRDRYRSHTLEERKVVRAGNEVGIKVGVTIPIQNAVGAFSVVSFSYKGRDQDFNVLYAEKGQQILQYVYAFNESILAAHAYHYGAPHIPSLTDHEKDLLKYLANGYTRKQIANMRFRAAGTIDKQVNAIIKKLNAKNIVHAVALALKWQLVS